MLHKFRHQTFFSRTRQGQLLFSGFLQSEGIQSHDHDNWKYCDQAPLRQNTEYSRPHWQQDYSTQLLYWANFFFYPLTYFFSFSRTFQGCGNFSRTFQWNNCVSSKSVLYDSNSYYTINISSIPLTNTGIHQRGFISGISPNNQQYVCILKEIDHCFISKLINYPVH